jgi:hypothetical protein
MENSQISSEILSYLSEHPYAQDTIEGIVEWWLLESKIQRHIVSVQEALNDLVQKGLVVVSVGSDSRNRYRAKST